MRVLKLSLKAASQLVERHVCLRQAAEPLMSSFCAKLGSLSGQPPLYVTFSHLGFSVTLTPDEFGNAVQVDTVAKVVHHKGIVLFVHEHCKLLTHPT